MTQLTELEKRIKGARLYYLKKANKERLYIPYGKRGKGIKTTAYFEVVNDTLTPVVKVENDRHPNYYDNETADRYQNEIYRQFRELINNCELKRKKTPLHERLKDEIIPVHTGSMQHQAQALRFACTMKVSAIYADTGTGKTKMAIDLCTSRYEADQIKKVLVFCPVSTKKNFKKEFDKWLSDIPLEIKITGIESVSSSDNAFLDALYFADNETQIIVDESHMIKNPIAKRSKRIKQCCEKASYKVVMTATPVTENVHNLYMQFACLSPLIIGVDNWLKFEEKFLIMGGTNGDEVIGYKNIDYLMGLIEPYIYQIDSSVLNLPLKRNQTLWCGLNAEQQMYYEREKKELLKLFEFEEVKATDIFTVFTRMQQITSGYYKRHADDEPIFLGSHKQGLLSKVNLSQPTVFFCKYIHEVDFIINELGKEKCARFTGQNPKERDEELEQFSNGAKPYFVATMQSGGTGLNGLQEICCQLVFYSNSFSYFQRKQSIGRIDRKGQEQEMTIIDFVTKSGIDNRIHKVLNRKGNLADEIKEKMKDKTELKKYIQSL